MKANYKQGIFLVLSGILLIASALAWLSYVAHGIAYGDLVGVSGRENDVAKIGEYAIRALWTAASAEAMAIGILWWRLSDPEASPVVRVGFGLMLAFIVPMGTYLIVRGL